jgi:hypothetical protein
MDHQFGSKHVAKVSKQHGIVAYAVILEKGGWSLRTKSSFIT